MRRLLVSAVLLASCCLSGPVLSADERVLSVQKAGSGQRIALVVGNSAYKSSPLANPVNDAKAISAALRRKGFDVIERTNATHKEMLRAVTQFGEKLVNNGVGLFFYAGHGIQVRGKNFLIPVDAKISSESGVVSEAVDVDSILSQLPPGALNLVILDACRSNPFERRFRSVGGGLAQIDAPKGTLIAYSTSPGKVAEDGKGKNSPYTTEFLKHIQTPGLTIEQVFKRVREGVAASTSDQQIPWESSSLTGEFYFSGSGQQQVQATSNLDMEEIAFWDSIRDSSDKRDFEEYLGKFPNGQFSGIAKRRIEQFQAAQTTPEEPAPVAVPTQSTAHNRSTSPSSSSGISNEIAARTAWKAILAQDKLGPAIVRCFHPSAYYAGASFQSTPRVESNTMSGAGSAQFLGGMTRARYELRFTLEFQLANGSQMLVRVTPTSDTAPFQPNPSCALRNWLRL